MQGPEICIFSSYAGNSEIGDYRTTLYRLHVKAPGSKSYRLFLHPLNIMCYLVRVNAIPYGIEENRAGFPKREMVFYFSLSS